MPWVVQWRAFFRTLIMVISFQSSQLFHIHLISITLLALVTHRSSLEIAVRSNWTSLLLATLRFFLSPTIIISFLLIILYVVQYIIQHHSKIAPFIITWSLIFFGSFSLVFSIFLYSYRFNNLYTYNNPFQTLWILLKRIKEKPCWEQFRTHCHNRDNEIGYSQMREKFMMYKVQEKSKSMSNTVENAMIAKKKKKSWEILYSWQ